MLWFGILYNFDFLPPQDMYFFLVFEMGLELVLGLGPGGLEFH